jgi:Domain of unknown function (DUF4367)
VRPMVPMLFINDDLNEENSIEEASGVLKRFDIKVAVLKNFSLAKKIYSLNLNIYDPKENIESFLDEDRITFTPVSSIRYVVYNDSSIYLTTLLMSRKASQLKYLPLKNSLGSDGSQGVREIHLKDGTTAMLFVNPSKKHVMNQIVFVRDEYYITIATRLPIEQLIKIVEDNLRFE